MEQYAGIDAFLPDLFLLKLQGLYKYGWIHQAGNIFNHILSMNSL